MIRSPRRRGAKSEMPRPRRPRDLKIRRIPKDDVVIRSELTNDFLTAGYELARAKDGSLAFVKGTHRVPVRSPASQALEIRMGHIIKLEDG